jgi:uncharacterized membrane protein
MAANPDRTGRWLLGALYWLPMITLALGAAGIPGAALVPIGFAAWLFRELAARPAAGNLAPQTQRI